MEAVYSPLLASRVPYLPSLVLGPWRQWLTWFWRHKLRFLSYQKVESGTHARTHAHTSYGWSHSLNVQTQEVCPAQEVVPESCLRHFCQIVG